MHIFISVKSDISRKKKRTMKIEPDIHVKRRRQQTRPQTNVRGNLQGNGMKCKKSFKM